MAASLMIGWIWFDACQDAGKPKGDVLLALPPTTNGLPADVSVSCTVSPSDFDKWFVSGKATENGQVAPANSVTFPHENNCSFYLWSQQMFLWLTSTLPGGATVMESPLFYTVAAADGKGNRQLVPNREGQKLSMLTSLAKVGPRGKPVMLNAQGQVIDTEEGQAGSNAVLIAQTGSVVYYLTLVNDVYAFFRDGTKAGKLNDNQFPTTAGARDSICAYARSKGVTLPDSNALALEIKTSWVEVANLPNPSSYVTIEASVPVYNKTNPQQWVPTGRDTVVKLALVGIHIVGSVAGHPEMIWATLEHNKNTPNASYQYLTNKNTVVTVPQDGGTGWLFSNNPADSSPNSPGATASGDTINGNGSKIMGSNTLRTLPWGVVPTGVPNQQDTSASASNSEIISINNAVNSLLVGKDTRKNYNLIGATWTFGGNGPNGSSYPANNKSVNDAIGTSTLANSTMETTFQGGLSCFSCHNGGNNTLSPESRLSHIFSNIATPIPMPGALKK